MLGPLLSLPKLLLGRPRCGDGVGCFTSGRGYSRLTFGNGTVDYLLGFERNSSSLPLCLLGLLPGGGNLAFGRCGDLRDYLLRICSTLLQLQGNGGINPDDSDLLQVASSFDVDLLVIILLYVVLLEVYAV